MLGSSGCWEAAAWLVTVPWWWGGGRKGHNRWMDELGSTQGRVGCDTLVFPPVKAENLGHS